MAAPTIMRDSLPSGKPSTPQCGLFPFHVYNVSMTNLFNGGDGFWVMEGQRLVESLRIHRCKRGRRIWGRPSITGQPPACRYSPIQRDIHRCGAGTAAGHQWKRERIPSPGPPAQAASISTNGVTLSANGNSYTCVVTNLYGTCTSAAATLTVTNGVGSPPVPCVNVAQQYISYNYASVFGFDRTIATSPDSSPVLLTPRFVGLIWHSTLRLGEPSRL